MGLCRATRCTFFSSLIAHGLIDELHLFINPVAIGRGMTISQGLDHAQGYTLEGAQAFSCGIVVLCYRREP